jgi:hypothetical protein
MEEQRGPERPEENDTRSDARGVFMPDKTALKLGYEVACATSH